jgi:hypothetical protein
LSLWATTATPGLGPSRKEEGYRKPSGPPMLRSCLFLFCNSLNLCYHDCKVVWVRVERHFKSSPDHETPASRGRSNMAQSHKPSPEAVMKPKWISDQKTEVVDRRTRSTRWTRSRRWARSARRTTGSTRRTWWTRSSRLKLPID